MAAPLDVSTRMYCSEEDVTTRIEVQHLPAFNLDWLIRVATARVERETARVFQRAPVTGTEERFFLGKGWKILEVDDLLSLSSFTVDDSDGDTDDLLLMPYGRTPTTWLEYEDGGVWPARAEVGITGAWGYAAETPWDIWDATVSLVVRALQRARTAYQDGSVVPELGEMVYSRALPADVAATLAGYRRRSL